jgi:hypothetical protein
MCFVVILLLIHEGFFTKSKIIFAAINHNKTPMIFFSYGLEILVFINCEPTIDPNAASQR